MENTTKFTKKLHFYLHIQGVPVLKVYIYIFEFQTKNGVKNSNTKNL